MLPSFKQSAFPVGSVLSHTNLGDRAFR